MPQHDPRIDQSSDEALPGYRQAATSPRDLLAKDPGNAPGDICRTSSPISRWLYEPQPASRGNRRIANGLKYKLSSGPGRSGTKLALERELAITLNGLGNGQIQLNKADDATCILSRPARGTIVG